MNSIIFLFCLVKLSSGGLLEGSIHNQVNSQRHLWKGQVGVQTAQHIQKQADVSHIKRGAEAGANEGRSYHRTNDNQLQYPLHPEYFQPAPLNPDGTVAETPEVREVKSHLLAIQAEARIRALETANDGWDNTVYDRPHSVPFNGGPPHSLPASYVQQASHAHGGRVAETPEVRAINSDHLSLQSGARVRAFNAAADGWNNVVYNRGQTPMSVNSRLHYPQMYFQPAPLNPDGTVAETPEVREVKTHHLMILAKATEEGLRFANDGWDKTLHTGHGPANNDLERGTVLKNQGGKLPWATQQAQNTGHSV